MEHKIYCLDLTTDESVLISDVSVGEREWPSGLVKECAAYLDRFAEAHGTAWVRYEYVLDADHCIDEDNWKEIPGDYYGEAIMKERSGFRCLPFSPIPKVLHKRKSFENEEWMDIEWDYTLLGTVNNCSNITCFMLKGMKPGIWNLFLDTEKDKAIQLFSFFPKE